MASGLKRATNSKSRCRRSDGHCEIRCDYLRRKVTLLLRRYKSSNPGLKPVVRAHFFQRIRSGTVRKIGFRTAILQLVLGALLVTVALIGAIGYLNSART